MSKDREKISKNQQECCHDFVGIPYWATSSDAGFPVTVILECVQCEKTMKYIKKEGLLEILYEYEVEEGK